MNQTKHNELNKNDELFSGLSNDDISGLKQGSWNNILLDQIEEGLVNVLDQYEEDPSDETEEVVWDFVNQIPPRLGIDSSLFEELFPEISVGGSWNPGYVLGTVQDTFKLFRK